MSDNAHPRLASAVEWLRELVAYDTVPANSNIPLIAHVAERLKAEHGITGAQRPGGDDKMSFYATVGPQTDGGVVLSGHTDVVDIIGQEWTLPPFSLSETEDKLYARGSCDMKGFVACVLAMAPVFAAAPLKKPVHFAFSRDEEIGCAGSEDMIAMITDSGMKPAAAVIGEPTRMQIVSGHKTGLTVKTEFYGSAAHSSQPANGVSAIAFAVRFASHLQKIEEEMRARADDASPFSPSHGTINVGKIAGGTALNILAAQCVMEWHYRGMPEEDVNDFADSIDEFLQNKLLPEMRAGGHPANIINSRLSSYPGLRPQDSPALSLVKELSPDASEAVVSFGTEAGHFQCAGIPSAVIGPGDIEQAHKPDEFIEISQMAECLRFLDRLCGRLSA